MLVNKATSYFRVSVGKKIKEMKEPVGGLRSDKEKKVHVMIVSF